jgi:N-acetylglucosamine-6-phosphate deacetylase
MTNGRAAGYDLVIRRGKVLAGSGWREVDVGIAAGRIAGLRKGLRAEVEVDAAGLHVAPGFVDAHVHGANGSDDTEAMAAFLPSTGVTSFLPTLASAPPGETLAFVERLAGRTPRPGQAEILGGHLEGPWLSPDYAGAHVLECLRPPDVQEARRLLQAASGSLRRVTIAPELPGARAVIELLAEAGLQVSLGHSGCSFEQAMDAATWGASSVTHVYNAMTRFHHRAPGLVGAAMASDRLACELIADGVHVHRAAALALVRARAAQAGVALVSDGLPALGLPAGSHQWHGLLTISDGTVCRFPDGTLAGSASSLLQGVRNLVTWGVPLEQACRMAAASGAHLAGAQDRKGVIAEGYEADLVLLDGSLNVMETYCRGIPAWSARR